jgi:hypothetical protein
LEVTQAIDIPSQIWFRWPFKVLDFRNETMSFAGKWMELGIIILSEMS